jgi:hypothetical protein
MGLRMAPLEFGIDEYQANRRNGDLRQSCERFERMISTVEFIFLTPCAINRCQLTTNCSGRTLQRKVRRDGLEIQDSTELGPYRHELPAELSGALLVPDSVTEVCN